MTYNETLDLSDGVAFAGALKVSTDIGDKLSDISIDPIAKTANCTFTEGTGAPVKPSSVPITYSIGNGVSFAGVLKVHTDIQNELVWIVVHSAAATADCWFV